LTLHREVLDCCVFLPVIGDGLVKGNIFVLCDLVRFAHPNGLGVVEMLPLVADLLDFLGLLFFLGLIFIDFLNLWLVRFALFLIIVVFVVSDFLFIGLFSVELDGESNEL
jgi:hypothetical protein